MTAMFGYLPKPTFISLFSYFGYWAIVLFCIGVKVWRGTLTDATKGKAKKSSKAGGKGGAVEGEEGGEEEEDEEAGKKGSKKPATAAALSSAAAADDSAIENSSTGGSEQDLPSAAPYLLPVVHKHLPHLGHAAAAGDQQPKAVGDVENGAAAPKKSRWWQRGKKE